MDSYDVDKFFKPESNFPPLSRHIHDFYKDTKILRDEGLLRLVPISSWIDKYDDVFSHLIVRHFSEPTPYLYKLTNLLENRRLIFFHDFVKMAIGSYEERVRRIRPEKFGMGEAYSEDYRTRTPPLDEERLESYRHYIRMAAGREVAYGLLGSVEFNAVPFSDLGIYTQYLNWLLFRLSHNEPLREKFRIQEYPVRIVREALRLQVPTFENIPDEELLEFREKRKDEIGAFRKVVDEIVDELQFTETSSMDEERLQSSIRSRLQPRISDLEKTLEEKVLETKKKRTENIAIGIINLAAFAYLPFEAVILPTILAFAKFTTDEIGSLLERVRLKKNGLYLLWEMGKQDV